MILKPDRVITGDGKTVLEQYAVQISEESGKITRVAPQAQLCKETAGEELHEYPGATLLPGLIDMHVHLGNWSDRPGDYKHNDFLLAYIALNSARSVFKNGVTTVRDVCTKDKLSATMAWAAENGIIPEAVPRIIPCGNGICMTGGHGTEFSPGGGDVVDGTWEMRREIRRKFFNGSQWIKLLTSKREFIPEYTQEELNAAADECHRRGRKLAAHSGVPVSIQMCIDAGVDTIEHGTFMSEAQAEQMRAKGLAWTPTILAYTRGYESAKSRAEALGGNAPRQLLDSLAHYQRAAEAYRDNFKRLYDIIGRIGAGTDLSLDMGDGAPVAKELAYMVQYGLAPIEAIRVGTSSGADILDLGGVTGTVKKGLAADLLLVQGDPSKHIEALEEVTAVYFGGRQVV